jgi:excisionase family DNA binding protein
MATLSNSSTADADVAVRDPSTPSDDFTLLTVADVAAMLKVSKSWVYEHTRRGGSRGSGLPFIKVGKYVRFDRRLVREFLANRTRRS